MDHEIEVSVDEQNCVICGKIKKGCYKRKDGTYICDKCLIRNIKGGG